MTRAPHPTPSALDAAVEDLREKLAHPKVSKLPWRYGEGHIDGRMTDDQLREEIENARARYRRAVTRKDQAAADLHKRKLDALRSQLPRRRQGT